MQCQSPNGRGTPADTSSVPTVPHHTVDLKELGLELSPEDERRVRRGRQRLGLRACATGVCTLAELLAAPTGSVDIAVHDVPVVTPVKAAKSAPTLPRAPTPPDSDVMEYVRLRVVALKRGRRERVTASADRLAPWDPKPAKLDPPDADGHFPSIKRWQRFTRWYQAVGSIARHPVVPLTAPATSAMTPAGTAIARSDTTGTSGVYREPTRLLIEEDIRESAYTFSVPAQVCSPPCVAINAMQPSALTPYPPPRPPICSRPTPRRPSPIHAWIGLCLVRCITLDDDVVYLALHQDLSWRL